MEQFNENETIYRRFKSWLSNRSGEYFDEDDIIDIFDTAGDFNDEYVRMEALFYGAKHYPDSLPLADRRAILYHTYSDTMRDDYLVDHPELVTFISSLLRLISVQPAPEQAKEHLANLVAGADDLEDEEVIQLVDTASALGVSDWLIENLPMLKTKTSYPQTLLYEIDVVFESQKRYDVCLVVLDELTMLEPFNGEFWRLHAATSLELGNIEQTLSSIDYALAINPADEIAMLVKAEALFRSGDKSNILKAVDILEPLVKQDPDRESYTHPLAMCYLALEQDEKLGVLLDKMQPKQPGDVWVAGTFMQLNPDKCKQAIADFAEASEHEEEEWTRLALFVGTSMPSEGADVLLEAIKHIELTEGWEMLMQLLYNAGRYEELCELVKSGEDNPSLRAAFTHDMSMLFVKSLLAIGETDNARAYAQTWCDSFRRNPMSDNPAVALKLEAISLFMNKISLNNK